ncbi:hypothetical protein D3C80_1867970 [compost metagenome]
MHDRQEVRRYIKQQGRQHQGQAAIDHVIAVSVELVAATRTQGLFTMLQGRLAQQQVALVTGYEFVQG